VVGTSIAVSTSPEAAPLQNVRLATWLQVFTVTGASAGAFLHTSGLVGERASQVVFGLASMTVAVVVLQRLDRRNVLPGDAPDVGAFGGRFVDADTGERVSYRVRRMPAALSASLVAGIVSSLTGIGGGAVVVPALNSWCGVPLRVAAATSTFMLGVTAIPGVLAKFPFDDPLAPALAAAGVLGVVGGARLGLWIGGRSPVRGLKILLAGILIALGARYLVAGF
jgi:uncharacterized membrane protein YfcA